MTAAMTRDAASGTASSPRPTRRRRIGGWIAIGIALVVVGGVGAALTGLAQLAERDALDPESPAPGGARAVAAILQEQGVEVLVLRDRGAAREALGPGATLVLPDAPALSDAALETLVADAADVVLIEPRARTLRLLLDGSNPAGYADDAPVEPRCDLPEAQRSGPVAPGAVYEAGSGVDACYAADDASGLLISDDTGRRVSAVDGRAIFANDVLAENGNAALALNLMGRHPLVVWYVPGVGETDLEGTPTLGELTPPWVSPTIVLLLIAGIAAGVWRGRRFGPLVPERLPVTVRASETTEGRARLYARSRDTVHAADQLRIDALGRLARLLGLGPAASAPEIADAAAGRLGWDRRAVRGILIDELPHGDAQLVSLRDRLRHLEEAVRQTVRPERNAP
ncbi:DUF4350 domain-containing protein [Microbacterium sp. SS28]|uniref:DUF4350 domain-containing protein n=1 Tax=Microbacterium sp. SS28 TaxID=2919948 RepID=UPI001FAAC3BF|nr:DUF4350 domain-containing protein [Microbacterium sp. SS28]